MIVGKKMHVLEDLRLAVHADGKKWVNQKSSDANGGQADVDLLGDPIQIRNYLHQPCIELGWC